MYTENSPEILEKIKAEAVWYKCDLDNWDEIVSWIEIIPKPPLRFLTVLRGIVTVLQQEYLCIVHFRSPLTFSSGDSYTEKYFSYWLNVPTEEQ